MRNKFVWLDKGTIPWWFLNPLKSHLHFNIILIRNQYSTSCHCESNPSMYATIYLTLSNTTWYSNIRIMLQLSVKKVTRTSTNIPQYISHTHIYTYMHTLATTSSSSYVNKCWIRSLLLVLYFQFGVYDC